MSTLGLVELREVCLLEAATADALFRSLGGWVADTADPRLQRALATTAHRSAWHAGLWRGRFPVVQQMDDPVEPEVGALVGRTDDERRRAAADALVAALGRLTALRSEVDADLDPSTCRVLDLVCADLEQLRELVRA